MIFVVVVIFVNVSQMCQYPSFTKLCIFGFASNSNSFLMYFIRNSYCSFVLTETADARAKPPPRRKMMSQPNLSFIDFQVTRASAFLSVFKRRNRKLSLHGIIALSNDETITIQICLLLLLTKCELSLMFANKKYGKDTISVNKRCNSAISPENKPTFLHYLVIKNNKYLNIFHNVEVLRRRGERLIWLKWHQKWLCVIKEYRKV